MQKTRLHKSLSFILCIVLIAAMALFTTGCKCDETAEPDGSAAQGIKLPVEDGAELGEGKTTFKVLIADKEGTETHVTVHTDKTIVGEALQEIGLLEGEEGEFGLYVKVVDGEKAVYEEDGAYWGFYVNGEYAAQGIDLTPIEDGAVYKLEYTKA